MVDEDRKIYRITAYGITREILGARNFELSMPEGASVGDLRGALYGKFPRLGSLRSLLIAVNNEYAEDTLQLKFIDDIALIPPVSGG